MARVVLVGLPGAGKTTVAREVAKQLGVPFIDTDEEMLRRHHKPAGQLLRDVGETQFRILELEALARALTLDAVVATGGGVVSTRAGLDWLRPERVVWLRADPATLLTRVSSTDRPLLDGDAAKALQHLSAVRDPLYAEIADGIVDAEAPIDDVVESVLASVGEWSA